VAMKWGCAHWAIAIAGGLIVAPAQAQNLEAGKTPAQIFSDTCSSCHKSARDLKRPTAGFMREHYTTSGESASAMAAYLAGVAGDGRPSPPKQAAGSAPANPSPPGEIGGRPRRSGIEQAVAPDIAVPAGQGRRGAQPDRPAQSDRPPQPEDRSRSTGQVRASYFNPRRPTTNAEAVKPAPTLVEEVRPIVPAEPPKPSLPEFEE
jgi:hypothetical protein